MASPENEGMRIDKWLWTVRLFKTRGLATEACRSGFVKVGKQQVKPSRQVKLDEIAHARNGSLTRTVKVIGFTKMRVGASRVAEFLEDLTPAEEYEKAKANREQSIWKESHQTGRPTKKNRRALDQFKEY